MKTCAIMITAFNTRKYIIETLESLCNQTLPSDWTVRFYIGVDACALTADVLEQYEIPFYLADKNVGTYVLTNSLIKRALIDGCDMFLRFDSDDIACENFLLYGISHCESIDFVQPYYRTVTQDLEPISSALAAAHGPVFFTKKVLYSVGGYQHYRAGCDTDFNNRVKQAGHGVTIKQDLPIFLYRQHADSLMHSQDYGKRQAMRREIWKDLKEKFAIGLNYIKYPRITRLRHKRF